jgi:hypothetical protein
MKRDFYPWCLQPGYQLQLALNSQLNWRIVGPEEE